MTPSPFTTARSCGGLGYLSEAARTSLLSTPPDPEVEEGTCRNRFLMGMGGGMGGGGGGILQVLLAELSGLKKPRGFFNRHVRRAAGHQAEAAAQVPDPHHDGHQPARRRSTPRCSARGASTASTRSATRRRTAASARTRATSRKIDHDLTRRRGRPARDDHALRDRRHHQGPRQRGAHQRDPRRARDRHLGRHREGEAAQGPRSAGRRRVHRARAPRDRAPRGVPRRRRRTACGTT